MQPQQDPQWCNAVQERLERLYQLDGRADRNHPQHAHYTGLHQKYLGLSKSVE